MNLKNFKNKQSCLLLSGTFAARFTHPQEPKAAKEPASRKD